MRGCEHLVSSQVLQKTIDELRAITRIDLCVLSLEGQKVASTFSEEGFEPEYVREFVKSPADSQVLQAYHFFKIYDDQNVEYVLVTSGGSEDAYMIGKIAVCEIQNLIVAYKERLDKNNFIQNLLLDNLLLVDIYNRAKKTPDRHRGEKSCIYCRDKIRERQQCDGDDQESVRIKTEGLYHSNR